MRFHSNLDNILGDVEETLNSVSCGRKKKCRVLKYSQGSNANYDNTQGLVYANKGKDKIDVYTKNGKLCSRRGRGRGKKCRRRRGGKGNASVYSEDLVNSPVKDSKVNNIRVNPTFPVAVNVTAQRNSTVVLGIFYETDMDGTSIVPGDNSTSINNNNYGEDADDDDLNKTSKAGTIQTSPQPGRLSIFTNKLKKQFRGSSGCQDQDSLEEYTDNSEDQLNIHVISNSFNGKNKKGRKCRRKK